MTHKQSHRQSHKQRMLAAIRGEPTETLPWCPRLDLWYRAHKLAKTLPQKYRDATLMEMLDDLGWAYHAVIANFQDLRGELDDAERGLGIYNLHMMPAHTILEGVDRKIERQGDRTFVTYNTPAGAIRTTTLYDDSMRRAGITISHVEQYAITSEKDLEAIGWIFEHAKVRPNYEGYQAFAESIGDRGIAVAFGTWAASPMHLIQRELMPMDLFFYAMTDHPEAMARLVERMEPYWRSLLEAFAACPADVVLVGANYDASIQYPPLFAEHITPWLKTAADMLHARGKYLLTHTDGENTGLLDEYLESDLDVADSICPKPMTKLTYGDVRQAFDGRITIMGGIPSVALIKDSMPDRDFDAFTKQFFR